MKPLMRYMTLLLIVVLTGCLEEVEVIDPETLSEWKNYTTSDGLAGNRINAITIDGEGRIWIGTDQGVSVYDGDDFTNYTTSDGLSNNMVNDVVEFDEDVMVFGTDLGLTILDHGQWYWVTNFSGTEFAVLSLGVDADGIGWIGTDVFGLLFIENDEFYQIWDDNCYDCNFIQTIYKGPDDTMYFGTSGGLKILSGSSFLRYDTNSGLPDNYVQSIYMDSYEKLWVGTYNGLCSRESGLSFDEESLFNSAPQNWAFTINQDKDGKIWFSSIGNGLMYYDGTVVRTLPESLDDERVSTISSFLDPDGNLWFGTFEGGLWRYRPN